MFTILHYDDGQGYMQLGEGPQLAYVQVTHGTSCNLTHHSHTQEKPISIVVSDYTVAILIYTQYSLTVISVYL